jgi:translation initiation factor 2-alpha kinase 3
MSSILQNSVEDSGGSSDRSSSAEASYDEPPVDSKKRKHESPIEPADAVNDPRSKVPSTLARVGGSVLPNLEARHHSTLFYLSLIEGRCRTQAANSINKDRLSLDQVSENDPEVIDLARHLFAEISKELHKAGVLPDEFAGRNLEELRGQYLNSFDSILNNIATRRAQDNSEQDTFRSVDTSHLLSFNNHNQPSFDLPGALALRHLNMAASREHSPRLVSFTLTGENIVVKVNNSAYNSQYNEICMLGRGGFGVVYKVHVCIF